MRFALAIAAAVVAVVCAAYWASSSSAAKQPGVVERAVRALGQDAKVERIPATRDRPALACATWHDRTGFVWACVYTGPPKAPKAAKPTSHASGPSA